MIYDPFMQRAIDLSREAVETGEGAPFAAVVVKDGMIIGEGINRVAEAYDATAHGEVEAIRDAGRRLGTWDLSGTALYTTCEPCAMCVAAIYWARIDRVYYANTLADAEALGFDIATLEALVKSRPADRATPYEPLMRESAHGVLEDWSRAPTFRSF
ncbi:nucleoside deaminase [Acuticoccus mangrovi]|uniref:Nucleoside deaminase n=1 Tax=Acuticoccus mangrovi TaxID=2796142 RepID=A0A934IRN9_9HYPH|nr:nucleoside deaminase [Acuticoccus mangrovi]MBJ3776424.1 nucleoside deaminase [Acuticoccus mangrovi]